MKIVHISDIGDDKEMLETSGRYIEKVIGKPDVIALTGDVCGEGYNDKEREKALELHRALVPYLPRIGLREKDGENLDYITDVARNIVHKRDCPQAYDNAQAWIKFMQKVLESKDSQYREVFKTYNGLSDRIFAVPGELDHPDLLCGKRERTTEEAVKRRLREQGKKATVRNVMTEAHKGVNFTGYCGNNPEFFHQGTYDTLMNEHDSNVVLLHSTEARTPEDLGLLKNYLETRAPDVVLTGHTGRCNVPSKNEPASCQRKIIYPGSKTVILNAGALQRVPGKKDFGTLLELDMDGDCFVTRLVRHDILGKHDAEHFDYDIPKDFYR